VPYDRHVAGRVRFLTESATIALTLAATITLTLALLVEPRAAKATLVFVRGISKPSVWVAGNDGSGARRLLSGSTPRISPDGQEVIYATVPTGGSYNPSLMVAPVDGGSPPRRLATGWRNSFTFAWSPDSQMVATVIGPEVGADRLVLIDVASGSRRTIATGYFEGVSFSPDGSSVIYGRAPKETFPPRSDVYVASVSGGAPRRITHDHRSLSPLWGPKGRIVFVKMLGARRRRYGPKNELYLMNADGSGVRRLTHTRVGPLVQGLTPTQWSASGGRLLTQFGGQDTSYAVTVNPHTGAEHSFGTTGGWGFVGTALSADGRAILGYTGGFGPGVVRNVETMPYAGGRKTIVARHAYEADWNR